MSDTPKPKRGRPSIGGRSNPITVPLRLDEDLVAEIDGVIEKREGEPSRNAVMREAIRLGLRPMHGDVGGRRAVPWKPMSELPPELEGACLLLWLDEGERGNGEIAVGMVVRNDDGLIDCFWTWGGPNSGSDVNEVPTKWALLPFAPDGTVHQ